MTDPTPRAVSEEDRELLDDLARAICDSGPNVGMWDTDRLGDVTRKEILVAAGSAMAVLISHGWGPVAQLRDAVSSTLAELERLLTEAVESVGQDKGQDECESPSVCHAAAATFAYARAIRALKTATGVTE